MKLWSLTLAAVVVALPALAQDRDHVRPRLPAARSPAATAPFSAATPGAQPSMLDPRPLGRTVDSTAVPTAADAEAFVAQVEARMTDLTERSNRTWWIALTYINDDTKYFSERDSAELGTIVVANAKEAARFDNVAVDPVTRRKLTLLKTALVYPAPEQAGAAQELARIGVRLSSSYATAKITYRDKQLAVDDIAELLQTSRDPDETKAVWERWHATAIPRRADFTRQTQIANQGARALGYADTGEVWRSWYDMPPAQFARTLDGLMTQIAPLYRNLQCYARARLHEHYGPAVQPRTGPIRADLLGDMHGLMWGNIYDILAPKGLSRNTDVTEQLKRRNFTPIKMVKAAEDFYTSIGLAPLPETFWTRSMFTRPQDREVDCHASAWNIDDKDDLRVKTCLRVTADDLYTAYHELGHNYYQRAYKDQSFIFRDGANDGFHEAIGDLVGLFGVTPTNLKQLGLIDELPEATSDIPSLLRTALDKIAFLPFAYIVDKWRWQEFAGETTPPSYNESWWALKTKIQGLTPPGPRPADAFDAAAKSHVSEGIPYARYFLATIYQFQFLRAACRDAGWNGPLNRCTVYGNKQVGARLNAMLEMGRSKPWPDALESFTGERDLDASAILDYFAPLDRWLTEQNKDEKCGW